MCPYKMVWGTSKGPELIVTMWHSHGPAEIILLEEMGVCLSLSHSLSRTSMHCSWHAPVEGILCRSLPVRTINKAWGDGGVQDDLLTRCSYRGQHLM
jgi:hypothetical protein